MGEWRDATSLSEVSQCAGGERANRRLRIIHALAQNRQTRWAFKSPQYSQGCHADIWIRKCRRSGDVGQHIRFAESVQRGIGEYGLRSVVRSCDFDEIGLDVGDVSLAERVHCGNAHGRHRVVQGSSQRAGLPRESGFTDGVRSASPHQNGCIEQAVLQDGLCFCEAELSQDRVGRDPDMLLRVANMTGQKAERQGS